MNKKHIIRKHWIVASLSPLMLCNKNCLNDSVDEYNREFRRTYRVETSEDYDLEKSFKRFKENLGTIKVDVNHKVDFQVTDYKVNCSSTRINYLKKENQDWEKFQKKNQVDLEQHREKMEAILQLDEYPQAGKSYRQADHKAWEERCRKDKEAWEAYQEEMLKKVTLETYWEEKSQAYKKYSKTVEHVWEKYWEEVRQAAERYCEERGKAQEKDRREEREKAREKDGREEREKAREKDGREERGEQQCGICFEAMAVETKNPLKSRVALPYSGPNCGHVYHLECIAKWLDEESVCPQCRTAISFGLKYDIQQKFRQPSRGH